MFMAGKGLKVMRFGEMLVFGRKFWLSKVNFVFLHIETHNKLWEKWPASRERNIFFSPDQC